MIEHKEENPFLKMHHWIEKEKTLGSGDPNRLVLATATPDGVPHSRIVAIKEITPKGILFFTQKRTKKVAELIQNPLASMTLWLAQQQRQIVLDGFVNALTMQENLSFWEKMPREQQLRFYTYSVHSSQPIESSSILDNELIELRKKYENKLVPLSEHYCGFNFIAESMHFYTLGGDKFSEVLQFRQTQEKWQMQLLSP